MKKNEKNFINRNKSVITGKKNLERLYSINRFPVYIGATSRPQKNDIFFDMNFAICRDTGIIQLERVLKPEIIYSAYHSEALGKIWKEHHLNFVNFIRYFKPLNVLEIGGSNGFIAKNYIYSTRINKWTIVEPNPLIKSKGKIKVLKRIFDPKFKFNENIDTVIHSHTLEHIYEPRDFLKSISNILPQKGLNIFSVPNLFEYMQNKQSNVLNFEHTVFLTEFFIDELLKMYGFEIVKKKYFKDHSIFYATRKINDSERKFNNKNKYKEYKKLFINYIDSYIKLVSKYNKNINYFDGEVYIFGAHVFSQFLIALGLKSDIKGVVDNSIIKQGKRLYGTDLKIFPPSILKKPNKAIILRAGVYQTEIKDQLLKINPNLTIWE